MHRLRIAAVTRTLFAPAGLSTAIRRLGFVQADPIRAPARAQDLILRHRVKGYVAGDLEQKYPRLALDEDVVYAYGFVPHETVRLLHSSAPGTLSGFEEDVLAVVREHGPLHPSDLGTWFGSERVVNGWGGYSKATKRALERLHQHGLLRVARRDAGVRVYEAARPAEPPHLPEAERMRALIRLVANILAPVPERTLSGIAAYLARSSPNAAGHRGVMRRMLSDGELVPAQVDGVRYVLLPGRVSNVEPPSVRILAPFDPVVWDRRRFEHLWGWAYRFEAYTPLAKRVRGYYALPLLWRSSVVGWANARTTAGGLNFEFGFVSGKPHGNDFERELGAELERFRAFMPAAYEARVAHPTAAGG